MRIRWAIRVSCMCTLIVVSELQQLTQTERWPRLVLPLSEKLTHSGLGRILEFDSLRSEAAQFGRIEAEEVTVKLNHFDYGRELVDRVVDAAGLKRDELRRPLRWHDFGCDDYFSSPYAKHGYFDEADQYWLIEPANRVYEDAERQFLIVGGPGWDGMEWGYCRGKSGLWVWYPIDDEFRYLAPTTEALLDGWLSGAIEL